MPNDSKNVAVGAPKASGGAWAAPLGTVPPAALITALLPAFKSVGYVGEDGVSTSTSTGTSDVIAWGGDKVRVIQTDHDLAVALTMIETTAITAGIFYHEDNVTSRAATSSLGNQLDIKINAKELPRKVWVFELQDGDRAGRLVLPEAQVTERGDVPFVHGAPVVYPLTMTAYPDAAGNKGYIYWDDGRKTA